MVAKVRGVLHPQRSLDGDVESEVRVTAVRLLLTIALGFVRVFEVEGFDDVVGAVVPVTPYNQTAESHERTLKGKQ